MCLWRRRNFCDDALKADHDDDDDDVDHVILHRKNTVLEYTKQYKYLGLVLDEPLDFTLTGDVLVDSASRALESVIC